MSQVSLQIKVAKLVDYLLNPAHPKGGPKAQFFLSHGFDRSTPQHLDTALREHAKRHWPGTLSSTAYGDVHELIGDMLCPDGKSFLIKAVWQIGYGDAEAFLVTAYPVF